LANVAVQAVDLCKTTKNGTINKGF